MPDHRTKLQTFRLRALKLAKKSTITRQIDLIRNNSNQIITNNRAVLNTRHLVNRNLDNLLRNLTVTYNRTNIQNHNPANRRLNAKVRHIIRIIRRARLSANIIRPEGMHIFPAFSNRNPFTRLALSNHMTVLPELRVTILTTLSRRNPAVRTKVCANRNLTRNFLTTQITRSNNNARLNTTFSRRLNNRLGQFTRFRANKRSTALLNKDSIRSVSTTRLTKLIYFSKQYKNFSDRTFRHYYSTYHFNTSSLTFNYKTLSNEDHL